MKTRPAPANLTQFFEFLSLAKVSLACTPAGPGRFNYSNCSVSIHRHFKGLSILLAHLSLVPKTLRKSQIHIIFRDKK